MLLPFVQRESEEVQIGDVAFILVMQLFTFFGSNKCAIIFQVCFNCVRKLNLEGAVLFYTHSSSVSETT